MKIVTIIILITDTFGAFYMTGTDISILYTLKDLILPEILCAKHFYKTHFYNSFL